jgi:hypothetical protein
LKGSKDGPGRRGKLAALPRRRALIIGLAGLLTACAGPSSPQPTPTAAGPRPAPTFPPPLPPPPTAAPTAVPPAANVPPAQPPAAAATPEPSAAHDLALDVRLWNGQAEVQLDGRTIQPGPLQVPAGTHQAAALVDGEVVSLADVPREGGTVDLYVPPPLASLAVMIENQADARPQTGLIHADVVYEALAEGGITRFISVFLTGDAPVVGPVRSLRHYFAFMAADYGADIVHIGASPEGFAWRDAMNMGHLDESAGDPGVWRIRSRPAPHNAYTATAADRSFLQGMGRQRNRQWGPLLFSEQAQHGEEVAESIRLSFAPWPYRVAYQWDAERGRYLRFMDGGAHRDAASDEQIAPATVVVQFAQVDAIPNDPKLRLDVNLVGASGQLMVFSDGTRREGTWTKPAPRSATRWLDNHGERLVIPPGPVWVEVVPIGSPVTWS